MSGPADLQLVDATGARYGDMNGLASLGAPVAPGAPPLVHSSSLGSGVQWGHSMDGPAASQYLTHAVRRRHAAPSAACQAAAILRKAPLIMLLCDNAVLTRAKRLQHQHPSTTAAARL